MLEWGGVYGRGYFNFIIYLLLGYLNFRLSVIARVLEYVWGYVEL